MTNQAPTIFVGKFTNDWPQLQAEVVGRIVIAFSQLERLLYLTPKRIRHMKLVVYRTWPVRFSVTDRCAQIEAEAAIVLVEDELARMKRIVARVLDVNERRNGIIHGSWIARADGERMVIRNEARQSVDNDTLVALLDEIRSVRDDLGTFNWPEPTSEQAAALRYSPQARHYKKPTSE